MVPTAFSQQSYLKKDDKMDAVMKKKNILDLSIPELEELVMNMGEKKFRALQIYRWIMSGKRNPADMTDISKELRGKLGDVFNFRCLEIHEKIISGQDNTVRYVLRLNDGNIIESVLMNYKFGLTVCISSQAGCKMGCAFCASARSGFSRNLSCGEMLDQVLIIQEDTGQKIGNVVVMGIGEPFDNYENLMKFLKLVHCRNILNMGYRRITVSTCGLVPEIIRFAGEKLPVNISVSLHAPDDELRSKIMPVNKKYSIDKLIIACKIYTGETNRRVTFEYIMISNFNDSKVQAFKLAKILKGLLCHVNLIPLNEIEGIGFKGSKSKVVESFKGILESKGIGTTIRRKLGEDIKAACGQLRKGMIQYNREDFVR
jgi:23S rRNA (adenine2503-C2)-methyltransferase